MVNYVAVIPFIYPPYMQDLKLTLKLPEANVNFIDNTDVNRGVAGSWNVGIEQLKERGADWLIIISAAMRFGEPGGLDMLEQIQQHPTADIIRFAQKDVPAGHFNKDDKAANPGYPECFNWHCTAISSELIKQVGKFDPNFYPIYFEDTDYDLRIKKAGFNLTDFIAPIDAHSVSAGHATELGGVESPAAPLVAYFATKWGRHPAAPQLGEYDKPFNNPDNSLAFFPPARGELWDE